MAKGISLHIGVGEVLEGAYDSWSGEAPWSVNDAKAMELIAYENGFNHRTILLTEGATYKRVTTEIQEASTSGDLKSGDFFFLSFAGHGYQRQPSAINPDVDETWVLYDQEIIDDEISGLIRGFADGVRVLIVSDSCHSGSLIEGFFKGLVGKLRNFRHRLLGGGLLETPQRVIQFIEENRGYEHRLLENKYRSINQGKSGLSGLLLAACRDNQNAGVTEDEQHGLFTSELLKVWNGGFLGNYQALHQQINVGFQNMLKVQEPLLVPFGSGGTAFASTDAFKI